MQGSNVETGENLPGFEGSRGRLSTTEKVRMRGLVERTRVAVVEVAGKDGSVSENTSATRNYEDTENDMTTDDNNFTGEPQDDRNHGRWEMEVARVYERTIVALGLSLDLSGIGGQA